MDDEGRDGFSRAVERPLRFSAAFQHCGHGVSLANGTVALEGAGVRPSDEETTREIAAVIRGAGRSGMR